MPTPQARIEQLATAVGFALRALIEPTAPPPAVSAGQLRQALNVALERLPTQAVARLDEAWAAARVACAYLAAGDTREAHQALLAADHALAGPLPGPSTTPPPAAGTPWRQVS